MKRDAGPSWYWEPHIAESYPGRRVPGGPSGEVLPGVTAHAATVEGWQGVPGTGTRAAAVSRGRSGLRPGGVGAPWGAFRGARPSRGVPPQSGPARPEPALPAASPAALAEGWRRGRRTDTWLGTREERASRPPVSAGPKAEAGRPRAGGGGLPGGGGFPGGGGGGRGAMCERAARLCRAGAHRLLREPPPQGRALGGLLRWVGARMGEPRAPLVPDTPAADPRPGPRPPSPHGGTAVILDVSTRARTLAPGPSAAARGAPRCSRSGNRATPGTLRPRHRSQNEPRDPRPQPPGAGHTPRTPRPCASRSQTQPRDPQILCLPERNPARTPRPSVPRSRTHPRDPQTLRIPEPDPPLRPPQQTFSPPGARPTLEAPKPASPGAKPTPGPPDAQPPGVGPTPGIPRLCASRPDPPPGPPDPAPPGAKPTPGTPRPCASRSLTHS